MRAEPVQLVKVKVYMPEEAVGCTKTGGIRMGFEGCDKGWDMNGTLDDIVLIKVDKFRQMFNHVPVSGHEPFKNLHLPYQTVHRFGDRVKDIMLPGFIGPAFNSINKICNMPFVNLPVNWNCTLLFFKKC